MLLSKALYSYVNTLSCSGSQMIVEGVNRLIIPSFHIYICTLLGNVKFFYDIAKAFISNIYIFIHICWEHICVCDIGKH